VAVRNQDMIMPGEIEKEMKEIKVLPGER